ncbi:MAG: histidine kinase, partial [Bacteroidia bacterium]|nr:histidine kinase [Bacteroidia bacterium]
YRLDGFDPIWIDCGERRTAYYTTVPSGEYTFQVRVKDGTGQWHPSSHPIKINIGRIFYRTLWFKSLLILFIIAIVLWWMNTWNQRARNREYERAISYFANSMHGSNQVQDILRDITDNVITRTNLVDCVIYLVDESGQALIKVAAYGENNAEEHDGINPLSIPIGSGIVGKVAASQQAMVIADTRNEPEYIPSLLQGRSEIAVPIVHDGRVLGVIDAEHPRRNFFKKAHLDLLTTIASISSSKIANAQKATEIEENERRLKELQSMVSETRQLALRAQMNPHFIFNCLNSINSFILDNDQETASRYLIKFAKLIRLILENSNSKLIPLQSELDALKLYIEMEALRFEPKFSWQIDVDEEVAAHHVMVPPLILQPFVENAIWHGLLHKSGPGNLTVAVTQPENTLTCTITDNGVGREASRQNKAASLNQKQSLGLKLTQERLALMHEQEQKKFKVEIFDLHDKEGNALGTQVVIEMELND